MYYNASYYNLLQYIVVSGSGHPLPWRVGFGGVQTFSLEVLATE